MRMRALTRIAGLTVIAVVAGTAAPSLADTTPVPPHMPGVVLVGFEDGVSAQVRGAAHAALGASVVNTIAPANLDVVRLPDGVDAVAGSARYARLPGVAYAHLNHMVFADVAPNAPNDVLFDQQWGFHNESQFVYGTELINGLEDADIDAPEGWLKAFGANKYPKKKGIRVGIIDTGVDTAHVDLQGKVKECAGAIWGFGNVVNVCTDDSAHGTHVAGIVGAITGNSIGVAGTAPNSSLSIFKGLNAVGGYEADLIAGLHWQRTTGQAKIISMSLSGPALGTGTRAAVQAATNAGILVIAAAGNTYDAELRYPAAWPEVMSVSSTDAGGNKSVFSTCNNDVEIAAPGSDVWSTLPGNTYGPLSGTSMATPMVSGVAAMIMWKKKTNAATTRSLLKSTGRGSGSCNGVKVVNLQAALA